MKRKSSRRFATAEKGKAEATAKFRLEAFLPYLLSVAANRVSGLVARRYGREFGITIPEWRCLAVLGSARRISATEISTRTAMDKVKVSRALASLQARGLARRAPHPTDRRLALVSLTPRGSTVFQRIVPLALETERQVLAVLSAQDERALRSALARLLERIDAMEREAQGGERSVS